MPVTKVNRSYNATALITYLEGEAHDDSGIRNVLVSSRHLHPQLSYLDQLRVYMSKRSYHSTKKRKIEAIAIIQSFAADELDPDDPDSAYICHEIGLQLVADQFPGCPCIVYTQHDGESHLYHNHIVVFNANIDDYRAIDYKDYNLFRIRERSDLIVKKYGLELSKSLDKNIPDKMTQAEYYKSELRLQYDQKKKEYGDDPTDEQKNELEELYNKSYSWIQDLKERVTAAMTGATSEQDFLDVQLPAHGLKYTRKGKVSKGEHKGKEFITYEMTDRSNIPLTDKSINRERLAAKSIKLGTNYSLAHLRAILQEKETATSKSIPKVADKPLNETPKVEPKTDNAPIPPPIQDTSSESVEHPHTAKKRKRNGKMKFDDEPEKTSESPVQTIDLKFAKKVIHNEVTQYENDISQQICDDLQDLFDRYTPPDDLQV